MVCDIHYYMLRQIIHFSSRQSTVAFIVTDAQINSFYSDVVG